MIFKNYLQSFLIFDNICLIINYSYKPKSDTSNPSMCSDSFLNGI